jgi:hypothetical protein
MRRAERDRAVSTETYLHAFEAYFERGREAILTTEEEDALDAGALQGPEGLAYRVPASLDPVFFGSQSRGQFTLWRNN